jgi:hypothetical protein
MHPFLFAATLHLAKRREMGAFAKKMLAPTKLHTKQVDPYAPDVTPSQMKKLTEDEKKKVAAFSDRLKKMNPSAYGA